MDAVEMARGVDGIAIIGIAGRFPGARSVEELWRNLLHGVESIRFFTDQELEAAGVAPDLIATPNYVKARGALGDAEWFDAAFFGHSPKVAELMDPQHRLFLQCAWHALESAGYDSERYPGRIGVYAGESMNTYVLHNLISHIKMVASVDSLQASIGNDKDSLTTEVSYKLNLRGPSVTIQTASSTSLVAVHQACQSLLSYECDMALAGGVSIHFPETAGYLYQEGGATSPDGHCRAFDAEAKGFVNGHGAGIVVLKRLEDALTDGDEIYAVIRGSAVNNDGSNKVSYMAPSVEGQAQVIAMAQAIAGVAPETISYVEAHGTGTHLGDPIEIAALTQAFRASTQKKQFCAIGSIKTNIGHLDTAAGVTGLIKTALGLRHRQIPASLHYETPNPHIDWANSPFYVNATLRDWPAGSTPRRAGVSSFGMGGTNAHVVVEEAPPRDPSGPSRPWQLLVLSAKSSAALETMTTELAAHIKQHPELSLADIAYTLQVGRRPFSYRQTLLCQDRDDAVQALEATEPQRVFTSFHEPGDRPVAFLFSGQGAQYPHMTRDLYAHEPVFRQHLDTCATLLHPHLGCDLRPLLFPTPAEQATAAARLNQTALTQPTLFAVEYALARLWQAWGVQPQALLGHSLGEYVAACLAGVFTLAEALQLVAARGRLMQRLPPGAMLAVPLSAEALTPLLGSALDLAALNAPNQCVVAGPPAAVAELEARLQAQAVAGRRLASAHAFHSRMVEPILAAFAAEVAQVRLQAPQLPVVSNVTGTWLRAAEATDPSYWVRQLRAPVRFAAGVATLLAAPGRVLLEVGPGQTLATLARKHPDKTAAHIVAASLRHAHERQDDVAFLLNTLAKLWLAGVEVKWDAFYTDERRRRVSLPVYPFERQRYWVEPLPAAPLAPPHHAAGGLKRDVAAWFYLPFWKPTPALAPAESAENMSSWLVFADAHGFGDQIARRLERDGRSVVRVESGSRFAKLRDGAYALNPSRSGDYAALIAELRAADRLPRQIAHLWNVTADELPLPEAERIERALDAGFYSLLFLAQALGSQDLPNPVAITVVSNNTQRVAGEMTLEPEKAATLGPCRVIPQEYPHIACRSVDIVLPAAGSWQEQQLLDQLVAECLGPAVEPAVAYRDQRRWVQDFETVRVEQPIGTVPKLRQNGVYLITGGLGGIGIELAEHLARTVQARLVLTSRSGLPPRDEWERWLATHDTGDPVSQKIEKVRSWEQLGAEVLVLTADAAEIKAMEAVIDQAQARFGALHGVIHAAGLVGRDFFQPIRESSRATCEQQFRAKIHGSRVLERVLLGSTLDFCLLCSSLASVLGGLGLAAYAAANLFMDAFAHKHNRSSPVPWTTVNWDAWQITTANEIPGATHDPAPRPHDTAVEHAIGLHDGLDAFERVLALGQVPQVIVSTGALRSRIDQWVRMEALHEAAPAEPAEGLYPRPPLQNAYVAPRNETEQTIARIWQEILQIEQVGIHDNFFDLGGNSLTGIQIIGQLKNVFNAQIPTVSLYEGPTVSALADVIDPIQPERPRYEASRSRGERRREKRRERSRA